MSRSGATAISNGSFLRSFAKCLSRSGWFLPSEVFGRFIQNHPFRLLSVIIWASFRHLIQLQAGLFFSFSLGISWKENSVYVEYIIWILFSLGIFVPEIMSWLAYFLESFFLDYVSVIWLVVEWNKWIYWDYVIVFSLLPFGKHELPDDCNSPGLWGLQRRRAGRTWKKKWMGFSVHEWSSSSLYGLEWSTKSPSLYWPAKLWAAHHTGVFFTAPQLATAARWQEDIPPPAKEQPCCQGQLCQLPLCNPRTSWEGNTMSGINIVAS